MNLHELTTHAKAGHISELNLISLDGGLYYLLEARMEGAVYPLNDASGHAMHLRSVEHARELLHSLPKLPFHLVHGLVHDEMCGLSGSPDKDSGMPISRHS